MTVMVALLRGVNVGGGARLPMADLRAVAEDLGYQEVATYIQSGNLVFTTDAPAARVEAALEGAIAAQTAVAPAVIVRTRAQLTKVTTANPYLDREPEPTQLHVWFAKAAPVRVLADVDLPAFAPEEAQAVGRELFLYLPDGLGRSRLGAELVKRAKREVGTMRNWRTVGKVLALADERT